MRDFFLLSKLPQRVLIALNLIFASFSFSAARGLEFSLRGPRVELRKIQFCTNCGKALIVNHLAKNQLFSCPSCQAKQKRLPAQLLKKHVLQICPLCQKSFDVHKYQPGTQINCKNCKALQPVIRAATLTPETANLAEKIEAALPAVPVKIEPDFPVWQRTAKTPHFKAKKKQLLILTESKHFNPEIKSAKTRLQLHLTETNEKNIQAKQPTTILLPAQKESPQNETSSNADNSQVGQPYYKYKKNPVLQSKEGISAMVNDEAITEHELELKLTYAIDEEKKHLGKEARTIRGRKKLVEIRPRLKRETLDYLINETLVLQQAKQEEVDFDSQYVMAEAKRFATINGIELNSDLVKRIRREMILREMFRTKVETKLPSPRQIKKYYAKHRNEFKTPVRVRFREIMIFKNRSQRNNKNSARQISKEAILYLQKTGDFAKTVVRYSEDIFAKNGGTFCLGKQRLIPPEILASRLRKHLKSAKIGHIVGPLELQNAFVIARLDRKTGGTFSPLTKVQGQIIARLQQSKHPYNIEKYLDKLRNKANIKIY